MSNEANTTGTRVAEAIRDATMPHAMATSVKRYLRATPEYERARKEKRATEWLDRESLSLGHLLAETVKLRLRDLDD